MISRISGCLRIVLPVCAAVLFAPGAQALERVTLKDGLPIECAHYERVGDVIRLYLDAGEQNYQEIQAARVVAIETVPDPPAVMTAPVASAAQDAHGTARRAEKSATTPTMQELQAMMAQAGSAHDIDTALLASVIHVESGFHVRARSRAGAQGLMQLMPGTAHEQGVDDAMRPKDNINGGTAYLDALLKRYHEDAVLALAAYNAGPAAVDKYHGVPPYRETRWYVYRVISEYNRRKQAEARVDVASR